MSVFLHSPSSHAWFAPPNKRRRNSDTDDSDEAAQARPAIRAPLQKLSPPKKRIRQEVPALENGLASLSIYSPATLPPLPHTSPVPPPQPLLASADAPPPPNPSTSSDLPEIHMKNSSWYEPEKDRIVILDLDSDDEGEDDKTAPPIAIDTPDSVPDFAVSSAYLARINAVPKPVIPAREPSDIESNRAVVLFMPPPWAPPKRFEAEKEQTREDDSMDIDDN